MGEPVDRLADRVRERGPNRDDHVQGIVARHRRATLLDQRLASIVAGREPARLDDMRQRLQQLPPISLEPVARPGPA